MRIRSRIALLCLGWFVLWFPPAFAAEGVAETTETAKPLRIGVLAFRGRDRALALWQGHADYLGERLGRPFEIVPLALAEIQSAIDARSIDLLITLDSTGGCNRLMKSFGGRFVV